MRDRGEACARGIESGHRSSRLQSAMEYLMTYGWAILIIAIVLVALFSLGVFNSANFAPKAPPGSCQVFRPNGPGTTFDLNLEGECNGELPQYVGQFGGGGNDYMTMGSNIITSDQVTMSVWADRLGNGDTSPRGIIFGQTASYIDTCNSGHPMFALSNSGSGQQLAYGLAPCPAVGQWVQYTGVYNGIGIIMYVNGTPGSPVSMTGNLQPGTVMAGGYYGSGFNFNGYIANIQIYNSSLSENDVQSLYREGIGGAPIDLQNLVGWWPLNGNVHDYSGNQNNGVAVIVSYTTSWTNGYAAP